VDAKTPVCRTCAVEMAAGVVLDRGQGGDLGSRWHEGAPPPMTIFGFAIGGSYKADKAKVHEVVGYRCPECGLLELYAR
jgi:hypothetical protein